jgi:hypothetical protein
MNLIDIATVVVLIIVAVNLWMLYLSPVELAQISNYLKRLAWSFIVFLIGLLFEFWQISVKNPNHDTIDYFFSNVPSIIYILSQLGFYLLVFQRLVRVIYFKIFNREPELFERFPNHLVDIPFMGLMWTLVLLGPILFHVFFENLYHIFY